MVDPFIRMPPGYDDSRFYVIWEHKISIFPRKCCKNETWIKPFTKAWRRTEEHKYLLVRDHPKWYSEDYVVWARLKGRLKGKL